MSVHYRMGSDDGQLPSGFRFRPTDAGVELLTHYLSPKAANTRFVPAAVYEVNLHKSKQWDLLPAGGGGEGGGGATSTGGASSSCMRGEEAAREAWGSRSGYGHACRPWERSPRRRWGRVRLYG